VSEEVWRVTANDHYEVSSLGGFRRVVADRIGRKRKALSTRPRPDGYVRVTMTRDGVEVPYYLHRLVCEAFNGAPPAGFEVDHIDGNRSNNAASNLRWAPKGDNLSWRTVANGERQHLAKLNVGAVHIIREKIAAGVSDAALGREFGVSDVSISNIRKGKTWKHITEKGA
jgi:hypothetical protein